MTNTVTDLLHTLKAPALSSKYEITITPPLVLMGTNILNKILGGQTKNPSQNDFKVLASATSLPGKTISTVEVYNRGRKYPIRGVATWEHQWDVTFYNTYDLKLRKFFEEWMYNIDKFDSMLFRTPFMNNYFGAGALNSGYMTNIRVAQLGNGANCDGKQVRNEYEIVHAWPIKISDVGLSAEQGKATDFTVTFAYDWWEPVNTNGLSGAMNKLTNKISSFFG